jgi:hypothetical protein
MVQVENYCSFSASCYTQYWIFIRRFVLLKLLDATAEAARESDGESRSSFLVKKLIRVRLECLIAVHEFELLGLNVEELMTMFATGNLVVEAVLCCKMYP